ncbi:serine hydrolase domain-containing protein [Pseudodonghicola flavimaris]|uniref:Serine hydrolase domain-containing protein n=1 Tax=Pseudodonghicola flavimaris TaxID=3050036 RepID=A0ABT7EYG4_9RHOB|nr:serine hydrolase domain-containing protein [Pseudodonghicola flavimaris]MDK3017383.1 serine hydrolase domain-containing protein [Pseudodonghicola flavimaris]
MWEAERVLRHAVMNGRLPFAVAMVGTSGGIRFSSSIGDADSGRPAGEDTVFRIFSMSKAIGALAALILIDRGVLSPETPVADLLPEWADLPVLEGWDGDTPILRPQRGTATLRHLATHTSGIEYEFWNADVAKYLETRGVPPALSGRKAGLMYPLTSDPGTRWGYGLSIDWLGRMVEAADGRPIDRFCREEIFAPLGMRDTRFEPDGLEDRLAAVRMRAADGGFRPSRLTPPRRPEVYGMGHALYSTAPDYMRFLRMVLNGGTLDSQRILSPETLRLMTEDQMQGLQFRKMISVSPKSSADVDLFPGQPVTHSMAFLRNETAIPGRRSAGSLGWAGICNTHYWIDPARDLAAVLMTQSLPFLDPPVAETYAAFESAVYAGL